MLKSSSKEMVPTRCDSFRRLSLSALMTRRRNLFPPDSRRRPEPLPQGEKGAYSRIRHGQRPNSCGSARPRWLPIHYKKPRWRRLLPADNQQRFQRMSLCAQWQLQHALFWTQQCAHAGLRFASSRQQCLLIHASLVRQEGYGYALLPRAAQANPHR